MFALLQVHEDQLTAFLNRVVKDSSLQASLSAEGADPISIAREAGFAISEADIENAKNPADQPLSDRELEALAGGRRANSTWSDTKCDFCSFMVC